MHADICCRDTYIVHDILVGPTLQKHAHHFSVILTHGRHERGVSVLRLATDGSRNSAGITAPPQSNICRNQQRLVAIASDKDES